MLIEGIHLVKCYLLFCQTPGWLLSRRARRKDTVIKGCFVVDSWQVLLWGRTKVTGEAAEVEDLPFLVTECVSYSMCDTIIILLLSNANGPGHLPDTAAPRASAVYKSVRSSRLQGP